MKLNQDRVHPGPGGQLLMAYALLKAWNAPSLVSSVASTPRRQGARDPDHGRERHRHRPDRRRRVDPLDPARRGPAVPDQPEGRPDRAGRPVVGHRRRPRPPGRQGRRPRRRELHPERSTARTVGDFTKAQLAEGVNLATLATPMAKQAAHVHQLTLRRAKAHNQRWRDSRSPTRPTPRRPASPRRSKGSTPSKPRSRSSSEPPPSPSRTRSS